MAPTVRMRIRADLVYEVGQHGADFVWNIHAARTASQTVVTEQLSLNEGAPVLDTDPVSHNRYLRLQAPPGPLHLSYSATVDLHHHRAPPASLGEVPVRRLPLDVFGYLYPSRYCPSDRLVSFAIKQFGGLWQGYERVRAIQDWVRSHVSFESNTSNSGTSALDTLVDRRGVCRDFAHLMIALCRAVNVPARFATGTDYGADPALGPPDFHAYVEAYLGDRWYMFDPSGTAIPMGMVRMGTGRDAADVSIAMIFGAVQSRPPVIWAEAEDDPAQGFVVPRHTDEALSTA